MSIDCVVIISLLADTRGEIACCSLTRVKKGVVIAVVEVTDVDVDVVVLGVVVVVDFFVLAPSPVVRGRKSVCLKIG